MTNIECVVIVFFSCIVVNLMKPDKHRNHSDFPEGDMHAGRVLERVNTTTVRAYHGNVIIYIFLLAVNLNLLRGHCGCIGMVVGLTKILYRYR
jgi:hypothetical protein